MSGLKHWWCKHPAWALFVSAYTVVFLILWVNAATGVSSINELMWMVALTFPSGSLVGNLMRYFEIPLGGGIHGRVLLYYCVGMAQLYAMFAIWQRR